ncbi:MAG: ABC transporter permease [Armatimonadetes bacterium]|nr:ABC transporter permease [Armatimonadota bacterium]
MKNKIFSLINILGLALGFACCIIIFVFVQNEFSFDRFHQNSDNIYRIKFEGKSSSGNTKFITTPPVWDPELSNKYPEILIFWGVVF